MGPQSSTVRSQLSGVLFAERSCVCVGGRAFPLQSLQGMCEKAGFPPPLFL